MFGVDRWCGRAGSAPRSAFDEDGNKPGCANADGAGRDPERGGPQPCMAPIRIKPLESVRTYPVCMGADLSSLPGGDLVETGLRDLEAHAVTDESLLVSIGRPRLVQLGLDVPAGLADPEHRLYDRLASRFGDAAHGRYNALVRRLVSFERALGCAGS